MAAVTVILHGALNLCSPDKESSRLVKLEGATTVGQLLRQLGVPVEVLSMLLLNDQRANTDASLADGDLLEVFPFCGGGAA